MPLFLDIHYKVTGATQEALTEAHRKDVEIQDKYGVRYLKYWYDLATERVFCLVEGPSKEAVEAVHREAHGNVADEIIEVTEGGEHL
jgi:hypothetical protein